MSRFRAIVAFVLIVVLWSSSASLPAAEHVVAGEPVTLDLSLVSGHERHHGRADLAARLHVDRDEQALNVRIEVSDDEPVFAADAENSDHIDLILAPPPGPYFDRPGNYFYSDLLDTRYWFPDDQVDEVIAKRGWIHETWPMPDSCYRADGVPTGEDDALMKHAPVRMGQVQYRFNPFEGTVVPRSPDPSGGMAVSHMAGRVTVRDFALTDAGYVVEFVLPPRALGLVPKTGVEVLRVRVDVVDVDDEGRSLASTSNQPGSHRPTTFDTLRFDPVLTFRPDPALPFVGTSAELSTHEQSLLARVPPYFLWTGRAWTAARIGRRPGDERGHDFCTAGIGHGLIPHEAELLAGPLDFRPFDIPGRRVAVIEGELIVDGKPVFIPEGEVTRVFAPDAGTLGVIDVYERRDRGRFSRGPCAAASSQYTDLVLLSDGEPERHSLHSQSTCAGWPRINGEVVDDEGEYIFDPPLAIQAAGRRITLEGGRYLHVWTLAREDGGWRPEYRREPRPAREQPVSVRLSELAQEYSRGGLAIPAYIDRLADIMGDDGKNLEDKTLPQAVCRLGVRVSPRLAIALADFAGMTPTCLIPQWTILPQFLKHDYPDIGALGADLVTLLESWRPESGEALRTASDYLVGGALLAGLDKPGVSELTFDLARRMLNRVDEWEAGKRYTESMYRTVLFRAMQTSTPGTWDILLNWFDDPDKADRMVETALTHYIMHDDREHFDHLFARHELPQLSYLYLLMIAADRPDYAKALKTTGVRFTDRFENGDTLLHRVAARRNAPPEWISPLAAAGVDPDAADADGLTALQRLYGKTIRGYRGDHESLRDKARALIAAGARVDVPDADGHGLMWHALGKEAAHGRMKPLMFAGPLLEAGIDVGGIDTAGTSALHRAVELGIDWVTGPLIEHGADPDVTDERGVTPLMRALYTAQTGLARRLLEAGADTAVRDAGGRRVCDYIGHSLAGNPARLHALRRDYGCDGTEPRPWPQMWPAESDCYEPAIVYAAKSDGRWSLHRIRPDGGGARRIVTGGTQPIAWLRVAPGLGHVGYSDDGDARVLACGEAEPVTVRNDAYFLDWYPDGERILVAGRDRSLCEVYVDGSSRCFGRSPGMSVDIAPDGRRLVTNYGASMPVIHDLGHGKTRDLLDRDAMDTRAQNLQPRFLPDGETVSYIHRVDDDHWRLMAGIPGVPGFDTVLEGDLGLWKYAWSPDGGRVVHVRGPAADAALFIHDRKTGGNRKLMPGGRPIAAVDWMW